MPILYGHPVFQLVYYTTLEFQSKYESLRR